jgi:hypothetical protein
MDSRAAIKMAIDMGDRVAMSYLNDLSDEDLMRRPHPSCNHLNWQIGHLISSENQLNSKAFPGAVPALPAGFAEKYTKETAGKDDPSAFARKAQLMEAFQQQRAATLALLDKQSDQDLDKPTGVSFVPTVGALLSLHGSHWLMHAGQWVIVRRQLGKPVVI